MLKDHSTVLDVQYLRYVFLCRAWWNNTTVYIFLNPICRPIEKSIPTIKFPWKYIHTSLLWGDWNEQIWFQKTGRESGLRSTDQAVNGYSSRPGTKLIHPKRPLEKGERGKRWGRKNMCCSLFLAAGMNYSARDRLTLAILFLVPLMTVVVNIHRQTTVPLLHNSLSRLTERNISIPSIACLFFSAPKRSVKNIWLFSRVALSRAYVCFWKPDGREGVRSELSSPPFSIRHKIRVPNDM